MKTTRRGFLKAAGVALGAALAGPFVPKVAEAEDSRVGDVPITTGAGRRSVPIPENYQGMPKGGVEIEINVNNQASPALDELARKFEALSVQAYRDNLIAAIKRNSDLLKGRFWFDPESGDICQANCRIFTAKDDMGLVRDVYLDGEDVTNRCFEFLGTVEPGECYAYAGLCQRSENGGFLASAGGGLIREFKRGIVKWEIDVEIATRNSERRKREYKRYHGMNYGQVLCEYATALNCTPADLTKAQRQQAFLNYVLEQST